MIHPLMNCPSFPSFVSAKAILWSRSHPSNKRLHPPMIGQPVGVSVEAYNSFFMLEALAEALLAAELATELAELEAWLEPDDAPP